MSAFEQAKIDTKRVTHGFDNNLNKLSCCNVKWGIPKETRRTRKIDWNYSQGVPFIRRHGAVRYTCIFLCYYVTI